MIYFIFSYLPACKVNLQYQELREIKHAFCNSKEKIKTKETRIHFISRVRQDGSRVFLYTHQNLFMYYSIHKNFSHLNKCKFSLGYDMQSMSKYIYQPDRYHEIEQSKFRIYWYKKIDSNTSYMKIITPLYLFHGITYHIN